MRQLSGILSIKGIVATFLLSALTAIGARAQEIELWGYGPALKDPMIQEVVMRAVDWSLLTDSIFGDPNLIVVLYPESEDAKIIDNYALEFNPELANDILYQTEYDAGFELSLFYNKNQSNMDLIAEGIADSLWELNIDITLIETQNEYEFMEKEESLVAERKDLNALMIWLFSANDAD